MSSPRMATSLLIHDLYIDNHVNYNITNKVCNLRKAQAEVALILGLVVIGVVVVLYSFSSVEPPSIKDVALTEEQKSVSVYAKDLVRQAALETLSELYRNGGYLDGSVRELGYIEHKGFGNVAYWQMCENYNAPDVALQFSNGVKSYIQENLPDTQMIAGRTATFSKAGMVVGTKIYENKVAVSAEIPTSYEGSQVPQPYVIEVSAKLGRIADFAENFARMQSDCRMFDLHLMKSLMQSGEMSQPCWIPYGTGNANRGYTFTWTELRDCMEHHAKYSVFQTKLGYEVPVDDEGRIESFAYRGWDGSGLEFFFIPAVLDYKGVPENIRACGETPITGNVISSDRYLDLGVQFYFGDDDGLDRAEFGAPDRLEIKPEQGSVVQYLQGMTVAEYSASYSVRYPVIVSVWDESVGQPFVFATYVYMDNNGIGTGCTSPPALPEVQQSRYSQLYTDLCIEGATEHADVYVVYEDDSPVLGAPVYFDGCPIGNTGQGEPVSGSIPPTPFGALRVSVDGIDYVKSVNYAQLADGYTFPIPRSKNYYFHFHEVSVSESSGTYTINSVGPVSGETASLELARSPYDLLDPSGIRSIAATESEAFVERLPAYTYDATGALRSANGDFLGAVSMTGFKPSSVVDDIHVYLPSMSGFDETDEEGIQQLYESCGLTLISNGQISIAGGCSWSG